MKIAIIDLLGLTYDGYTLGSRGLGGSESAVILMSKELQKLGFDVTVFNNCEDSLANPGNYNGVEYVDHSKADVSGSYDVVISSRSVFPFMAGHKYADMCSRANYKVIWMHDTFCEGDEHIETMLNQGIVDQLFTLSDFHTNYVLNCEHGVKRNFEVLKNKIFQTRNGAVKRGESEVSLRYKEKNHFVYNASVTKGLKPLLNHIWPKVKEKIPEAKLTVIGGYYRFREGAEPDAQEKDLEAFKENIDPALDVTFTGVINQNEIGEILRKAGFMLYPTDFPETFGISTLESLLYNTPVITCNFGALESTALDLACYKIDYASVPNGLFPNINEEKQSDLFVDLVINAYNDDYLLDQKRSYCNILNDIHSWYSVALQWKQHIYFKLEKYLPPYEYKTAQHINDKVNRIFNKTFLNEVERQAVRKTTEERRIVIISPFRNAENYLKMHCQSIDQQDYDNYLHILINDASEDGSSDIISGSESPKRMIIDNVVRKGCIANQLHAITTYCNPDDIVMLLDGDDFLVSNNTIFNYYNELYDQGYCFTYGSCWSLADGIPLIAQDYPERIKKNKDYRNHLFNWKIPYTHLRTCEAKYFGNIPTSRFKDDDGNYIMSGADNPLFYELIEKVDWRQVKAVQEIFCYYNDLNPLNDYKINAEEQNINANRSYKNISLEESNSMTTENKKILIAIPTNAGIEPDTFRSIYNMSVPEGYETHFEFFYGYQIDQIRNLIADWGKKFDYLFSIDSDIVVPKDALTKMLSYDKDAVSGVYIQRFHDKQTSELYYLKDGRHLNYQTNELPQNSVIEVDAFGLGCALIKGKVFKDMDYPHFVYSSALDHSQTLSEDVYFCMKAKNHGFKLYADTSIICDHIGKHNFKVESMLASEEKETTEAEKLTYDIEGNNLYSTVNNDQKTLLLENFNDEPLDILIPQFVGEFADRIRIDSQRRELEILNGSVLLLEKCKEVVIRILNDQPDTDSILQFLVDMGFKFDFVKENEYDKDYYFTSS